MPSKSTSTGSTFTPRTNNRGRIVLSVRTALEAAEHGDLAALAAVLKALSTPTRLTIFDLLAEPLTAPQIRSILLTEPGNALSVLAAVGLIEQNPGVIPRPWHQVADARRRLGRLLAK